MWSTPRICTRSTPVSDIYIIDIVNCSQIGKIRIFADGTSAFVEGHNAKEFVLNANTIINYLCNWFKANRLTLSTNKSCFVLFRSAQYIIDQIPSVLHLSIEKNLLNT
ncbi:unnamed protein product [Meganyctiphanes norvegica]|uniref:Reverse transcriptase domain-containing protein n=1 Tax=Meganyctiphanes norvegica TaxID=48144 RepID=A0AAV2QPD1_MEGNR